MLTILLSGLPVSAKEIVNQVVDKAFNGAASIKELSREELRSRVRLSMRSVEIVLVILDGTSSDICKDIEGGLYQSDKYYCYTDDKSLVEYLNEKYNINIIYEDVNDLISQEGEVISGPTEEYYKAALQIKNDTIRNLEARIREIASFYTDEETVGSVKEAESLRDENIRLNGQFLDLKSNLNDLNSKLEDMTLAKNQISEEKLALESRLKEVSKKYDVLLSELDELKVLYSKQSGVIRDKDAKVKFLESKVSTLGDIESKLKDTISELDTYKVNLSKKEVELSSVKSELSLKEEEITGYLKEVKNLRKLEGVDSKLADANKMIDDLRADISELRFLNQELKREEDSKDADLVQLNETVSDMEDTISSLEEEIDKLKLRVEDDDKSLAILNEEKIRLQNENVVLRKSSDSDDSTDYLIQEVRMLKGELSKVSSTIYFKMASKSSPTNSVPVLDIKEGELSNIRFVFSGNTSSRKGTYKSLMSICEVNSNTRYLLVDLVSETFVDYVFEMKKVVPGLEWLRKGGSVQPYISPTKFKNIQVLAPGLGYINDSYFLVVDWNKRLQELNSSGYTVIFYCGDISNIVGRVLYESFSQLGKSSIYVEGNVVSSRSIITNLRGLFNAGKADVVYFDFNPTAKKFYDLVDKTNNCRILSLKELR